MIRRDAEAAAESPATNPLATAPPTPLAPYQAGLEHLKAGRHLDAQLCCEQAFAIDPSHADSLQLMGLIALQTGQYDHAVEWLSRAIRQEPRPEYLSALGLTLKQAGRPDDALAVFDKAVQLAPDDAELWKQLAGALVALSRPADALVVYQQVLKLDPRHFEAAYWSGVLLHQLERFEEALTYFNLCHQWQDDHAPTLLYRARTLRALKRHDECLQDYQRLHEQTPDDLLVCNNIGDALLGLDRTREGLEWFERALLLRPDQVAVLANKGLALYQLHRFDEAIAAYAGVKALDPDDARSAWQLAHLHLQTGNFDAGWIEREARWKVSDFSPDYPKFAEPKWLGNEDINDKTILVCTDEGIGDAVQFARYVPLLAARGANVVLVVQGGLCPLLSGLPGVSACLPFGTRQFPPFDMHCPIMSLPLAFGTTLDTIPPASYLPPLPSEKVQAWKARLGAHDRLRVGLAWSGNPKQGNDRRRSMPLRTLAPLFDCDATFVSLQKDLRADDKAFLEGHTDIIDLTVGLTDFAETAALIASLDLVITVCTSIAHLAGTLGRETWVMLPHVGDWRWLAGRDDSPWYPTVRLFRQDETHSYAAVVEHVRNELLARISTFGA
ncbi:MAG TPA: tetratricopeptide repeat protein [Bradyrhizobium sp.]|uniref:tetratricopeptide repeat protein n=1 Tax=Bradyrhizobium sp. TaxID=376 RepID=UPI002C671D45|nr:tetratricopeptide repeat protein [Bradyrhizobium sp.]HLZ06217.1 tetratricopeptide repeat protein [Bradyrhizobium sp.]